MRTASAGAGGSSGGACDSALRIVGSNDCLHFGQMMSAIHSCRCDVFADSNSATRTVIPIKRLIPFPHAFIVQVRVNHGNSKENDVAKLQSPLVYSDLAI